jgi:Cys-rich repeat protein
MLACGLAACKRDGGDVACSADEDCPEGLPRCNPETETCVECLDSADCPSGHSCTDGFCMDPGDEYAAARVICIDKINELRATKGLPPYGRWSEIESCVDDQANADQSSNDPHGTFGDCSERAQNECMGHGVGGVESCLESMWAEKDQPGCAGCDACNDSYDPDCPGCDFYGSETGDVCGHYVNMSALYFTKAACGFSEEGGWITIDFR